MAGMAGLEPADAGVKVPCLTTWRHPNSPPPWRKSKGLGSSPNPLLHLGWVKGLEPSTPGTTIRCSNQLSYTHQIHGVQPEEMARQKGFEPLACCLEGSCSIQLSYWRIVERVTRIELASPAWKAGALAIVLHPRMGRSRSAAANRQLVHNSTKRSVCQVLFRKLVSFFVASLPGAAAKLQGALPHHPFDDLNEARSVLGQG